MSPAFPPDGRKREAAGQFCSFPLPCEPVLAVLAGLEARFSVKSALNRVKSALEGRFALKTGSGAKGKREKREKSGKAEKRAEKAEKRPQGLNVQVPLPYEPVLGAWEGQ